MQFIFVDANILYSYRNKLNEMHLKEKETHPSSRPTPYNVQYYNALHLSEEILKLAKTLKLGTKLLFLNSLKENLKLKM